MNHAKPIRRIRNILLILTVSLLAVIATGAVAFADEDAAGAAWTAPAGDMRINLYGHDIISDNQGAVKGYKKVSKKVTKLKAKKTYYVKVRTYKTVKGKRYYSPWSKVKTVKTK